MAEIVDDIFKRWCRCDWWNFCVQGFFVAIIDLENPLLEIVPGSNLESNHNKYIANTFINKQIQRSGNYDIRQNKPRKVFLCYVCVCGDSMSSQGLGDSSYLSFSIECNKRMYCNRFGAFHFNFQQIKSLRRDLWYIREIESFEQKCTLYQRVKPFKRFMI